MALQDKDNPSLYRFADVPQPPDPFLTDDYVAKHRGKGTTIVIDNGCWQCRVGWSCDKDPALVFRNAIAKTRGKKGEGDGTCIGNDITHIEAVRSSLRNQFDRNLVFNFGHQEQIFDYAFSHLGLGEELSVEHPVVVTEPVCNPSYCRAFMTELLFEGYGVPSLAHGIDALFSAHHHWTNTRGVRLRDALVVSSGHQTTHIIPLLDGRIDAGHCKRINLGGMHSVSYLHRLLQLKYPDLQAHVSLSRAQELLEHHCYTALDYTGELREWAAGLHDNDSRVVQLPYNQASGGSIVSDVSREMKDRQRKQRARVQLLKLNQRKREEKIASYQEQLERLAHLQQLQETEDTEDFQIIVEEAGYESVEALYEAMERVKTSLETEQEKLATLVKNLSVDPYQTEGAEKGEEPTVSEEWLQSLKERRKELLEQKRHRHQRKAELGKRRSAASQNRMRIISQLGAEDNQIKKRSKKTKEDTFGMNDEDWNVYRDISKTAGESDSEREDMELSEISKVLEKHDPSFNKSSNGAGGDLSSYYQLSLGVERLRIPEIVFQPTMVGVDQCGVSDTVEFILQYYPPEVQQRLVENVYISGGNTMFPSFADRVRTDLQAMRPFKSSFSVFSAEDGLCDAWRGGCSWANSEDSRGGFVSRAEYEERGAEYFKEHVTSNLCITPTNS